MVHALKGQQHPKDKSQQLQRKLYLAAKDKKNRRFHALYDRIYRPDILWRAWCEVRANKGSSGIDGVSIEDIESSGPRDFVKELSKCLKAGNYKPLPVKRVNIPKSDGKERPLGIPTIKDRVVQQACRILIEPIFEANFLPCSFGFRPKKSARDAISTVRSSLVRGWWIIDADIKGFFDDIDHDILMSLVKRKVSDRRVLKLIRQWLSAGVLVDGNWNPTAKGTPQGGVITPPTR